MSIRVAQGASCEDKSIASDYGSENSRSFRKLRKIKIETQFDPQKVSPGDEASVVGTSDAKENGSKSVCRVVFLGAAKVGKTSIIHRFLNGSFEPKYTPTVDDVYFSKFMVRGCEANVEFMDTSGSYDFPAMIRLCVAKADAFVIVFAHDNMESLVAAGRYLEQIKAEREDYAPLATEPRAYDSSSLVAAPSPLVVVCNKSDLPMSMSKISEGAIMEWLLKSRLKPSQFVYTSAKSDEYILDIFKSLWSQNELTHAISFSPWMEKRRGSAAVPETFSQTEKKTESPGYDLQSRRGNFFRSSFRVRNRNSSRQRRARTDFIRLDCAISIVCGVHNLDIAEQRYLMRTQTDLKMRSCYWSRLRDLSASHQPMVPALIKKPLCVSDTQPK
nr:small GTPase Ras dva 3 [Hymenolepis microstoma]